MKSLLFGRGDEVTLPIDRDPEADKQARLALLQYIRCEPDRMYMVGPISLWLKGGFNLERVETILEQLVYEGILRHATKEELQSANCRSGYYLTTEGKEALPPEDRSFQSR
jgi:hypothetical protein